MSASLFGFLLTIAVLVWVHEYGHYRAALACGVRVLRFSIGFGPVLFSRRRERDGCEFVISLLPLGGYVRMLDEREGSVPSQLAHQAFNRRPLWQRSVIVAAGPFANFALAGLLYLALNLWGVTQAEAIVASPAPTTAAAKAGVQAGDRVLFWSADGQQWESVVSLPDLNWHLARLALDDQSVWVQVQSPQEHSPRTLRLQRGPGAATSDAALGLDAWGLARPYMAPVIQAVQPDGAAKAAGLMAGDRVMAVRGQTVVDADSLRQWIRAQPIEAAIWTVRRGGDLLEITVTPQMQMLDGGVQQGRVGALIGADPAMTRVRWGLGDAAVRAIDRTWELTVLSARLMGRMISGELSWTHLSGPLTIADVAGRSVERGAIDFLGFLALVSVSLGLMNLIPLPMLDGGHLMYHLYEGVTGRPVPNVWLERFQRLGMALLMALMAVALFNDLARWSDRL